MKPTPQERFWPKVEKTATCWNWLGPIDANGCGRFYLRVGDRKYQSAHRAAWALLRGPIPEGLTIDHLCRNRRCVNVEHLEVVTMQVNNLRGEGWSGRNARKTRCPKGHPLEPRPERGGGRFCRMCQRAKERRRKQRVDVIAKERARDRRRVRDPRRHKEYRARQQLTVGETPPKEIP